jgi:histidine triad (HIT) family protein
MSNDAPPAPPGNIFSRILSGELPSHEVYSDSAVYAFLDIFPSAAGHTIIVPREYSANAAEASTDALAAVMRAVKRIVPALLAVTGAEGCNIVSNVGAVAGQTIEYTHFHLIPRSGGDGLKLNTPGNAADQEALAELAARLRESIGGGEQY